MTIIKFLSIYKLSFIYSYLDIWTWETGLENKDIHQKMEGHISDSRRNFAYFRAVVIEKLLNLVLNESNEVAQEIEKLKSAANRICSNEDCKTIYKKVKYKCHNCNSKSKYKSKI